MAKHYEDFVDFSGAQLSCFVTELGATGRMHQFRPQPDTLEAGCMIKAQLLFEAYPVQELNSDIYFLG